jgi:hypothetical protein
MLRKAGYQVIWAKDTGCAEFDVEEGRAGYDIRFYPGRERSRGLDEQGSFDDRGRLIQKLYVSWQAGKLKDGTEVTNIQAFYAMHNIFKTLGSKLDIVCEGPGDGYSISINPAFVKSNVYLVYGYGEDFIVRADDTWEAVNIVYQTLKAERDDSNTLYRHHLIVRKNIDPTPQVNGVLLRKVTAD